MVSQGIINHRYDHMQICEIRCIVYNFRKSFYRVYESVENVLDVLFSSPAGVMSPDGVP